MLTKNLLILALLLATATIYAKTVPALDAAKQKFAKSDQSEAARLVYLGTLADLLSKEVTEHIFNRGHGPQIDALNAELKKHPFPKDSDSKALTKLRAGHWQSPRHTYIFRDNGTWRLDPKTDGTSSGTWHIKGNQFTETWHNEDNPSTDTQETYTILVLNQKYCIVTDGQAVFFEYRL